MGIWYWGSEDLPDRVVGVVDRARDIGGDAVDRVINLGGGVISAAGSITKKLVEVQTPYNPIAQRLLDAYFNPDEPDPIDALAEEQYGDSSSDS